MLLARILLSFFLNISLIKVITTFASIIQKKDSLKIYDIAYKTYDVLIKVAYLLKQVYCTLF